MSRISLLLITLFLVAWVQAFPAFSDNLRLYPFSANYHLEMAGIELGSVTLKLEITPDQHYRYSAHTVTSGIGAILRDDEITEISEGRIDTDFPVPINYRYRHAKSDHLREVNLSFDWNHGRVKNRTQNSLWTMSITPGTQDKLSQQLGLVLAMNRGEEDYHYRVADGGRIKQYVYTNQGSDETPTPAGNYHTIRLSRSKDGKRPNATYWMAQELNFLPIKVIRTEGNKQVQMILDSITWKR